MERDRIRVALLSAGWPGRHEVGGAARYGFRLSQELAKLVDLTIVTTRGGSPVSQANMHYLNVPKGRFAHYYFFPILARRYFKKNSFDLIHAFGDDWALPRRTRVVRTFHGSSKSEAKHSRPLRKLNHWALFVLEKYSRLKAISAISVGPESQREFNTDWLIPPILPKGFVTIKSLTPNPSVLFIGTWAGRKRGYLAFETVEAVGQKLGVGVQLSVVGNAKDAENWPSEVVFHSDPDDETVANLIAQHWVLIAPSSYEGFGIPAFEAAIRGTPALSTPNPGSVYLSSLFQDDSRYRVCPENELASSLLEMLERVKGGRDDVESEFTQAVLDMLEKSTAKYLVDIVYRDALSKPYPSRTDTK